MDGHWSNRESKPSPKVYISNLSIDTTEDDLRKAFKDKGTIVEVTLKHKDTGIVFAFIQFESVDGAEEAVKSMNQKEFMGKELKVQFARGNRDRDRGDRGGYRGRGDRGDRDGDRRNNYQDRPRGCFNCQEEGHIARDCPKPRQPRQFNRDRGGFRNGGDRNDYRGERADNRKDRDYDRKDRRKKESNSRSRSGDKKRKYKKRSSSSGSRS